LKLFNAELGEQVTITRWHVANFSVLAIGLLIGRATSGAVIAHPHPKHDIIAAILAVGMTHLFLLTLIACVLLILLLARGRATGLNGLVVYFGIGICVARLYFQPR
jgi:hypothetical protein